MNQKNKTTNNESNLPVINAQTTKSEKTKKNERTPVKGYPGVYSRISTKKLKIKQKMKFFG